MHPKREGLAEFRAYIDMKMVLSSDGAITELTLTVKLIVFLRQSTQVVSELTAPIALNDSTARESLIEYSAVAAVAKQGEAWGVLLARLESVVNLGDQLAEVSIRIFYNSK